MIGTLFKKIVADALRRFSRLRLFGVGRLFDVDLSDGCAGRLKFFGRQAELRSKKAVIAGFNFFDFAAGFFFDLRNPSADFDRRSAVRKPHIGRNFKRDGFRLAVRFGVSGRIRVILAAFGFGRLLNRRRGSRVRTAVSGFRIDVFFGRRLLIFGRRLLIFGRRRFYGRIRGVCGFRSLNRIELTAQPDSGLKLILTLLRFFQSRFKRFNAAVRVRQIIGRNALKRSAGINAAFQQVAKELSAGFVAGRQLIANQFFGNAGINAGVPADIRNKMMIVRIGQRFFKQSMKSNQVKFWHGRFP
jgi:hypothetical protein